MQMFAENNFKIVIDNLAGYSNMGQFKIRENFLIYRLLLTQEKRQIFRVYSQSAKTKTEKYSRMFFE